MTKRLFGSIFMASALALLLVAVSMLFFSSSTQAGHPTTVGAAAAQSTQVAKIKQAAGTWADIAPFPTVTIEFTPGTTPLKLKRAGASAYSLNQKLYLLGGRHGTDGEDTTLRRIFEYTPGSPGTWVQKAALLDQAPVGSRWTANMAVAELADTSGPQIYAIGGSSIDSAITMTVRIYNPIADTVSLLPQTDWWPASPARIPGGWAVVNNKLYIFGGFSALGAGSVFTETWQFDPLAPAGSKWTQKANMNLGRGFIAGSSLDGQIYAIGGDTWNGSTLVPVSNVERYDPVANTWTNMASLPTARGDMGAWAYDSTTNYEISGRIAVAGGVFPVPDALGYLYNPTTNSWSSFPSMVHATRNYGYAQLNGYLYALGGYDYTLGIPSGANFNQRYDATARLGTPTPTPTGTLPTATPTRTSTLTPTITPTPCGAGANYSIATGTATIVAGATNIGSACDDCVVNVVLPFPFQLYDQIFTGVDLDSNGKAHFPTGASVFANTCLPQVGVTYTIYPYWDDLLTTGTCTGGCGIFTSVSGVAPNRIFNIEWRTTYFSGGGTANYELRLYEGLPGGNSRFDIIYGVVTQGITPATGGVQKNGTTFTQSFCNGTGLPITPNNLHAYSAPVTCGPTFTPTRTATPTACPRTLNGHLTYQGMPQPNAGNVQPITLQLQLSGGGPLTTYNTNTDQNANFTINLGALPAGTYTWWLKSSRYLASSGTLTIPAGCAPFSHEFGTQRAGDINNDNCVDITDFSLLRASFGKACGDPGYNPNAEYNGDCLVDISDFTLLRGNFGQCGPPPQEPGSVRSLTILREQRGQDHTQ